MRLNSARFGWAFLFLVVAADGLAQGATSPAVEQEGSLRTETLVQGRVALIGRGYRLASETPVRDFMGRYRIESDLGSLEAVGIEELEQRVKELPAARRLLALERSDTFAKAMTDGAKAAGQAVVKVVTRPGETLAALPAGLGRALVAAGRRVRNVATSIGDATRRDDNAPARPTEPRDDAAAVYDFAKELAGVNKARRAIAKDLGIDPYTRNPLVAEKLTSLAWAAVAGGFSLDLALSAVPDGARETLGTAGQLNQLAWELPPADVRYQLEQRLSRRGHEGFVARELLRNPAFSPTDQIALVETLERIDVASGERDVIALATGLPDPHHARFLIAQLRTLADADARQALDAYGVADGLVWGKHRDGSVLVPLPVDHVSWTAPLAAALAAPARSGASLGVVKVSGSVSPMARQRLQAAGWRVDARVASAQ